MIFIIDPEKSQALGELPLFTSLRGHPWLHEVYNKLPEMVEI